MPAPDEMIFLFDVDNTLLDNDRVEADINAHIERECGSKRRERFWEIFEELRSEVGYADYLGTLQRFRVEAIHDPQVLTMSSFLLDYPFVRRVYPRARDALAHVRQWGRTVLLSDGEAVFQPRKIRRAGLWDAVEGRVLIYVHKERMLNDVTRLYPAARYVMVDDKLGILAAMKQAWGDRLTTVFPRQGHYAHDERLSSQFPAADLSVEHVADLVDCNYEDFAGSA